MLRFATVARRAPMLSLRCTRTAAAAVTKTAQTAALRRLLEADRAASAAIEAAKHREAAELLSAALRELTDGTEQVDAAAGTPSQPADTVTARGQGATAEDKDSVPSSGSTSTTQTEVDLDMSPADVAAAVAAGATRAAALFAKAGDVEAAALELERALAGVTALVGPHALESVDLQSRIGGVRAMAGELDAAETAYRAACQALAARGGGRTDTNTNTNKNTDGDGKQAETAAARASDANHSDTASGLDPRGVVAQVCNLVHELAARRVADGSMLSAVELVTAAVAGRQGMGPHTAPSLSQADLVSALSLARAQGHRGDLDEAESVVLRALVHASPAEHPEEVSNLYRVLGDTRTVRGDAVGAEAALAAGVAALQDALPSNPHPAEAALHGALGRARLMHGDAKGAVAALEHALDLLPTSASSQALRPEEVALTNLLGMAHETLAGGTTEGPHVTAALAAYERGLAVSTAADERAAIGRNLGMLLARAGDMKRARAALEQAVADVESATAAAGETDANATATANPDANASPAVPPQLALEVRTALGQFLWKSGDPAAALAPLMAAVTLHHALHGGGAWAPTALDKDQAAEVSESSVTESTATGTTRERVLDPGATPLYAALGSAHYDLQQWAEAIPWLLRATEAGKDFYEPESPALGMLHFQTGIASSRLERFADAEPHLTRALALWEPVAPNDPLVVQARLAYAMALGNLGRVAEALGTATATLEQAETVFGAEHAVTDAARELCKGLGPGGWAESLGGSRS